MCDKKSDLDLFNGLFSIFWMTKSRVFYDKIIFYLKNIANSLCRPTFKIFSWNSLNINNSHGNVQIGSDSLAFIDDVAASRRFSQTQHINCASFAHCKTVNETVSLHILFT